MMIPIFYSISDNFTNYAAVSLSSLVDHTSSNHHYTVIFLHQFLSKQHKADLRTFKRTNVQIKFCRIDQHLLQTIQNRKENYLRADFFTPSIFYRLFIPELFPQYDKAIYLDSDTIVNADLANLYKIQLKHQLFAACVDSSIQQVPKMIAYIRQTLALDPKKYINSGVLLLNCRTLRAENFLHHFFKLLTTYHFDCIAPDQDYLNEIGAGRIYYLNKKWDAMPNEKTRPLVNPFLIHYNLFFKPWHFQKVQYAEYFWQNAATTKFYSELKNELTNYTEKQRQADRAKLHHMLHKEDKAVQDPQNWAHIKEEQGSVTL